MNEAEKKLGYAISELVESAKMAGRAEAFAEMKSRLDGMNSVAKPVHRAAAKKSAPTKAKKRGGWSGLTPEARLARINAIRKGRGLAPRTE